MGQFMIDTEIKVSTCNRCSDVIFACQVSGFKVMADPKPLGDMESIRGALIEGKGIYRVNRIANKPHKLKRLGAGNAITLDVIADHSCGMSTANNSRPVEAVPLGPHQAPVTPGRPVGGFHPATALAGAQTSAQDFSSEMFGPQSRVVSVTHHRSKIPYINRVCPKCKEMIGATINVIGVQIGDRWAWVQHDEC